MKGAIIGDIVGSVYEFANIKTKDFPLFNEEEWAMLERRARELAGDLLTVDEEPDLTTPDLHDVL